MTLSQRTSASSTNKRCGNRRGFSMLDLLVAFTLLVAAMSISTPLVVRHAQLLKSQRNYRLALDELTNQLELLTALPPGELPAAVQAIAPSDFTANLLPNAHLSGRLAEDAGGMRVSLDIAWDELGHRRKPVAMAAWVFEDAPRASTTTRTTTGATPTTGANQP